MKKKLLLLLFCVSSIAMFAQDNDEEEKGINNLKDRRHEVRIDAVEGLAVEVIDLSYEYVLGKYSGVGLSVLIGFEREEFDRYTSLQLTPFYRQYFFNKKDFGARGFYAEGVLNYARGRDPVDIFEGDIFINTERNNWSRFGVGFALGQKWISKNGFIVDVSLGAGRNFGPDDNINSFFRGGVNIGYRF